MIDPEIKLAFSYDYQKGLSEGYIKGYTEALKDLPNIIERLQAPKIIVTTQENVDRIKKEYHIE